MTDTVNLFFNGKELALLKNGQTLKSWPAMSGHKGYQHKNNTSIADEGPIPEGIWHVRQKNHQSFDDLSFENKVASSIPVIKKGSFPGGGLIAWGHDRIWLEPSPYTETFGRKNFSIHGGWKFGSAGCIDLAGGMSDFMDYFKGYNDDLDLIVRYPDNF